MNFIRPEVRDILLRWREVLVGLAALALLVSNTPFFFAIYQYVLSVPLVVTLGDLGVDKPLLLWINDRIVRFPGLTERRATYVAAEDGWARSNLAAKVNFGG